MLECRTTTQESPLPAVAARFDVRRVYTVLALAPLIYLAIRYLPPVAFMGLVIAIGAVALTEFYRLGLSPPHHQPFIVVGLLGFAGLVSGALYPTLLIPGLLAALAATLTLPLIFRLPLEQAMRNGAVTLLGVLYLGITLGFLVSMRQLEHGEWWIVFLLLVTWVGDTAAYYVGTAWGRHQLAPRISPKKSLEGLVGGVIGAILVACIARWWFLPMLSAFDCVMVGAALTGIGFWGDLVESAMKRSVGAKDSGGVLPGHGGMLDRLDSLLFTAPAFYYYVTLLVRSEAVT